MVERVSKELWIVVATVVAALSAAPVVSGLEAPCFFVFGDSYFHNGAKIPIPLSLERANYIPYGIDFPQGPTGRFSNGRNIADVIAELAGFNFTIPPFSNTVNMSRTRGINYASTEVGIHPSYKGNSLIRQIDFHESAIRYAGVPESQLKQCLYIISMGTHDFRAYFYENSHLLRFRGGTDLAVLLGYSYRLPLLNLYSLGARNVALFGVGQLGYTPWFRKRTNPRETPGTANEIVQDFNNVLEIIVSEINKEYSGAKFTYVDLFSGNRNLRLSKRFTDSSIDCCETIDTSMWPCKVNGPVCSDRTKNLFWDGLHITEAANVNLANLAYSGSISSPYTISQLVN